MKRILIVVLVVVGGLTAITRPWLSMEEKGIYLSHDNQVVYLKGEACTANYSPDPFVFRERLKWCQDRQLMDAWNSWETR